MGFVAVNFSLVFRHTDSHMGLRCLILNFESFFFCHSDNEDTMSMCSFGSRADLHRIGDTPVPSWVQIGEPVIVLQSSGGSKNGTVQFIGTTEFAAGNWVGVSLETRDGNENFTFQAH